MSTDLELLCRHWDSAVRDPPGRRLPLPVRKEFADIQKISERIDGNHWPPSEIQCSDRDSADYLRLKSTDPGAAAIVSRSLTVFLVADEIVMDGLDVADMDALPIEYQALIRYRNAQEVTHSAVYSRVASFTLPPDEFDAATQIACTHPAIVGMRDWARKYMQQGGPTVLHLMVCALFEVLAFSALFVVPHVMKKTGNCPAFSDANETISRDETTHMDSGAASVRCAFANASLETKRALMRVSSKTMAEGYEAVVPLLTWVFEGGAKILGVDLESALAWTRFCCNRYAREVNCNGDFTAAGWTLPFPADEKSSLPWMDLLSVDSCNQRSQFFERATLSYDKKLPAGALKVPADMARRLQEGADFCDKLLSR